jgi:hypothetical protein
MNCGKSDVVHGSLAWFELRVELKSFATADGAAIAPAEDQQVPAGLWEALLTSSSSKNRPSGKLLSSFDNSVVSVATEVAQGILVNKYDLLCPRPGCGSIILKKEVGELVERASEQVTFVLQLFGWDTGLTFSYSFNPLRSLRFHSLHRFLRQNKQLNGG